MMNSEKLERYLLDKCANIETLDNNKQTEVIGGVIEYLKSEWELDISRLRSSELKALSSALLTQATKTLNEELQELLLQKERIERQLNKKSHALQSKKHQLFGTIESQLKAWVLTPRLSPNFIVLSFNLWT